MLAAGVRLACGWRRHTARRVHCGHLVSCRPIRLPPPKPVPVPARLIAIAVEVVHEIGTLMLVGGLFFLLFVQLPAIRRVKSSRERIYLRQAGFGRLFIWCWLGLLLLWGTAVYDLYATDQPLPPHVALMALLSAVFTLLFLLAQFGIYMQVIISLEDGNAGRASWLQRRLRALLILAFVLALVVMVLDVSGAGLMPLEGFGLPTRPGVPA